MLELLVKSSVHSVPKPCCPCALARFDTFMPVQRLKPVLTDHLWQPVLLPEMLHRSAGRDNKLFIRNNSKT